MKVHLSERIFIILVVIFWNKRIPFLFLLHVYIQMYNYFYQRVPCHKRCRRVLLKNYDSYTIPVGNIPSITYKIWMQSIHVTVYCCFWGKLQHFLWFRRKIKVNIFLKVTLFMCGFWIIIHLHALSVTVRRSVGIFVTCMPTFLHVMSPTVVWHVSHRKNH